MSIMTIRLLALLLIVGTATPALAGGQGDDPDPSTTTATAARVQPQPPPVSIERIRRELRQAPPAITQADLKYFVQVYGQAPKIELFIRKEESVGAVPWGAPTHQDFLNLWTPEAFRAPAVDFNALLRWLAQQASKKKDGGG